MIVKEHPDLIKIGNDEKYSPESVEVRITDLFEIKLPKCRPNAIFTATAYVSGKNDNKLHLIDDPAVLDHFKGGLEVKKYQDQELESITLTASREFCE